MTEARLVTLLRALVETRVHLDGPTGRFGECQHHLEALDAANVYLADLPAAAPAEGLREALELLVEAYDRQTGEVRMSLAFRQQMKQARAALARHESGSE